LEIHISFQKDLFLTSFQNTTSEKFPAFLSAFAIVLLATPPLIKVAKMKHLVDEPGNDRKRRCGKGNCRGCKNSE
jgi:hypothetical protein